MEPTLSDTPPSEPTDSSASGEDAPRPPSKHIVGKIGFGLLVLAAAAIGALGGLLIVYSTDLPQIADLERYRPSTITELYDAKGRVIGSFALQRRVIVSYDQLPKILREAVLSIEDKDFEKHWGIDFSRIFGAAARDLASGSKSQGASTLTMQLSRNLFLSPERSFSRKFQETMLAIQIERRFTKPQIFAMYANQIYLGHGVYGFEAGAEFYFGKPAKELTLPEAAMLAALPKSPAQYSPLLNPMNALRRRNLVLNSMLEDGLITVDQAAAAKSSPIELRLQSGRFTEAPYFVEEIRQYLEKKYGSEEVHQNGLKVYTTLDLDWQRAANQAALDGVAIYERRHGWKGKLRNVVAEGADLDQYDDPDWSDPVRPGAYFHALVTEVTPAAATLKIGRYTATIEPKSLTWTGRKSPRDLLKRGDIAYVKVVDVTQDILPAGVRTGPVVRLETSGTAHVSLEQDSGTQVALLAIDNASGDIKAMVGGRDFNESKFNRAVQALRQVGSSFKPYVYTAAIDTGAFSPEDTILDAPITFPSASGPYTPSNYDGKFWGNITLAKAVANSRNIPALKVADEVGIKTVISYARRFGVTSPLPEVLPLALGAAEITLYEQTAAFATFPNDGVRPTPRYIRRVTDYDGHIREEDFPEVKDVIGTETARTMVSLLRGVVREGTATAAKKLNHPLAGKTGTTNDFTDAWFIGFSPSVTCGVWIGFDEKKTLGNKETGGEAALPIWIDFMKTALQGRENEDFTPPEGAVDEKERKPSTPPARAAVAAPQKAPGR